MNENETTAELIKNALVAMMDSLDYEAIAAYYKSLNWFWTNNLVSPTISELKAATMKRIDSVVSDKGGNASSGGICVRASQRELRIEIQRWEQHLSYKKIPFAVVATSKFFKTEDTKDPITLYFNAVGNFVTLPPDEYRCCL